MLRHALVMTDIVALTLPWLIALPIIHGGGHQRTFLEDVGLVAMLVSFGVLILRGQGLYLARVSSVRLDELSRLVRSMTYLLVGETLAMYLFDIDLVPAEVVLAVALSFVNLLVGRGAYRAWLSSARTQGAFARPVVVIGTNDEARRIVELTKTHPETGLDVVAVYGDEAMARRHGLSHLYAGTCLEAEEKVRPGDLTGAILAVSALDGAELNRLVRSLAPTGLHISLTSGVRGVASQRLRMQSVAHEPMVYLETVSLSRGQMAIKRTSDILLASLTVVFAAPVIAICALAVKLQDGANPFFVQDRVGKDGRTFRCVKIRTMIPNAEDRLDDLLAKNERKGPLFKLENDPRFTRIGRVLDLTSLNELPQLWNVLKGDMSIVGPRPALPREVQAFDADLMARFSVRPGITGLWQVEARNNPSFEAYKRYDLHYVENWSVTLDVVILLSTVEVVFARLMQGALRRAGKDPEVVAEPETVDDDAPEAPVIDLRIPTEADASGQRSPAEQLHP